MDCGPPGSSVHGIFQARIPEWVAISFSRPDSGIESGSPALHVDSHGYPPMNVEGEEVRVGENACLMSVAAKTARKLFLC